VWVIDDAAKRRDAMTQHAHETPPAETMFRMITGYWVSQAVGALAELGVVDALAEAPAAADALAGRLRAEPRALARLLRAAASLGVLARDEAGRYAPTPLGDTLRAGVPGSMRGMAIAQRSPGHWLPWGRFADAVRTGSRQTPAALGEEIFQYYGKHPDEAAAFTAAMGNLSGLVAREVARVLECRSGAHVVDIGGANGTLATALLRANPELKGTVLDLPHVVGDAKAALAAAGLAGRCDVVGGDFFAAVPAADLYLLKQILHDWDDPQCLTILRNCARGLRAGGRVVIVEMVIPDDGRPSPAQLMDLNMLVMLPGQERSRAEYARLLQDAGLRLDRLTETHSPFQVIEAVAVG
jgi:predicted O-methyltransferase YrrM